MNLSLRDFFCLKQKGWLLLPPFLLLFFVQFSSFLPFFQMSPAADAALGTLPDSIRLERMEYFLLSLSHSLASAFTWSYARSRSLCFRLLDHSLRYVTFLLLCMDFLQSCCPLLNITEGPKRKSEERLYCREEND